MATTQKIVSNLWFDNEAEEAAKYYTSIFKDASMGRVSYYGKEGFEIHGGKEGSVLTVEFTLNGQNFMALNGGPLFKFNESVSFMVMCESQEEIDYYWEKLSAGGDKNAQQCGWLKDKYGLSWQVAPKILGEWIADSDRERADRVMKAMLKMKKLNLAELEKAYNEKSPVHQ